ncbi:MAG TPA: magnesium transporter CorA family protein [Actinocrinis sp.]|nr:magnesium transporter CorA family protein [Actinocrinis sp.]
MDEPGGTGPGSDKDDETAAPPTAWRSRAYRSGELVARGFPLADLSEWLEEDDVTVWLDLPDPTPAQLDELSDELGLHELAIEDAVHQRQRPKIDRYEGHNLLSAYAVRVDGGADLLHPIMITAFITQRALVTVHRGDEFPIDEVTARWDGSADLAKYGVSFLLYGLIDYIVDGYFDALQAFDDIVEELSDNIFEQASAKDNGYGLRRSFELRRGLLTARRVITPMREVVNTLMRRDVCAMDSAMTPYFQDVYDHTLRAAEWTDNLRDLIGTIRETYLAIQSNRMNLIMKKVTSWAAIIAVPTAVTGWYGQNLPYPGFDSRPGFWTSTALIIGISVALYLAFRRRDWL